MPDPRLDTFARALAAASSRRQLLRTLAGGVAITAGALVSRRPMLAKPWHPSDCAAHPEVCVCRELGQTCATDADCCDGTVVASPIKCVDGTCQCCHPGAITCGSYSNTDICHDPAMSMALCCEEAGAGLDCEPPDASCVWVGCTPGVDPDCDPNFPYPACPPGFKLTVGQHPAGPRTCGRLRAPRQRKAARRRSKRRRAR